MWRIRSLLLVVFLASSRCQSNSDLSKLESKMQDMEEKLSAVSGKLTEAEGHLNLLTGQMMMQQLAHEEKIRTDGGSGLKQNRVGHIGTRPYHAESHTGGRYASIHNHNNHIRTIGMGEVVAVLNGVEFKTRHNDFQLKMPVTNDTTFKAVEDIPYPEVPPEVLNKATLDEQIIELRRWFKAWSASYYRKRDYRKYFKANVCFMEGFWTLPDGSGKVDEPFDSERHAIDAASWHELLQKIRFSAYTGRKDAGENYAFLPTKIVDVINGSIPVYAQWNYRIVCHPISRHIPLNAFRVIDDINARKRNGQTMSDFAMTRAARFQLNPRGRSNWKEGTHRRDIMDSIMEEVPGLNNGGASLVDDAFGYQAVPIGARSNDPDGKPLNVAYYHRYFSEFKKGAMGGTARKRGYSDLEVFMAMTTQPRVASSKTTLCKRKNCKEYEQRWSYAIPLEIVYTTPLNSWNPFDIPYRGPSRQDKISAANKRNGGFTVDTAFNGSNSARFYHTPVEFFKGDEVSEGDQADTALDRLGLLDSNGTVRAVKSSGLRIHIPDIEGVGMLRQRWPVAPVHGEGSAVWKELDALKDITMAYKDNCGLFYEKDACPVVPTPTSGTNA
ncbi:uncharacterized protein LOC135490659 [Lineus longissimus]|uniref:uncharacterized protein LOC135490659 n=1 Tax=Lineus longissimus TaxID=88925 RepID=UPI00315DFCC9